jgi:hypothetical protein
LASLLGLFSGLSAINLFGNLIDFGGDFLDIKILVIKNVDFIGGVIFFHLF